MPANPLRLTALALLALVATALAACGDSDESIDLGPDPASMVPADTPFYAVAVVRPEGELGDDLESALSKLLITDDVGAELEGAIDSELADEGLDLTYDGDIAPWLGIRAGAFLNGYDAKTEEADGALVVAVTDAGAAQSFVDQAVGDEAGAERDYNGVRLTVSRDGGSAYAIDGDFLLIGSVPGVEDAIDAGAGDSFAELDDASTGLDAAPDGAVFELYADPQKAIDVVEASGAVPAPDLARIEDQLAGLGDGPFDAWGSVTESSFSVGAAGPAGEGATDPTDLLTALPGDSWLAFAGTGIGDQISSSLEQFKAGFEAGLEEQAPGLADEVDPEQVFQEATGLDLERDLGWIGDVGGFVEGTSIFGLGGGLVITTDDQGAAEDAVAKLQSVLSGSRSVKVTPTQSGFDIQSKRLPFGAHVAVEDDEVVVAAGADTIDDVLSPTETLADSDTFQAAEDDLDDGLTPSFFVNFAPIVDLIDSTGESDPDLEAARPYLNALDFLIAGSDLDGDRSVGGFTLGVQDQPEGEEGSDGSAAVIAP
ncbi:MAG: DUF3352 domain-containing protein [Acidobacteria bacterium]|nr:MAG: DUF3352 domain-containing protein [Acidobacteriota bacterium]MCL4287359.1 DUF3352 domain-containing protein [Thermoleophilia bacterium]GIK77511.1 MAG: hypothetical protein BroJett022_12010 [Actinomycetes bacterium]